MSVYRGHLCKQCVWQFDEAWCPYRNMDECLIEVTERAEQMIANAKKDMKERVERGDL